MNILLHTIALEPARWTPQRVSCPLVEMLPHIAEKTEFRELEIFEPHLSSETISPDIREAFGQYKLTPVILSSYLNLNPTVTSDAELDAKIKQLAERVDYYGFKKLRLFPGPTMNPADSAEVAVFTERLKKLVSRVPGLEVLLETHDGSLADDPKVITRIVEELAHPDVALLFQATFFQSEESILEQFHVEKPYIRHVHLQNRAPDLTFVGLTDGMIPWPRILNELGENVAATVEFVPAGICAVEEFDMDATLKQARAVAEYVRSLK